MEFDIDRDIGIKWHGIIGQTSFSCVRVLKQDIVIGLGQSLSYSGLRAAEKYRQPKALNGKEKLICEDKDIRMECYREYKRKKCER